MPTPSFPRYEKGSLKPNPTVGMQDYERDSIMYKMGGVPMGDFGDEGASATRTPGIVKPGPSLPDEAPKAIR
jgi:hypothetical protein